MRRFVLAILLVLPLLAGALPASAQDAQYEIKDLITAHDIGNEAAGLRAYDINDRRHDRRFHWAVRRPSPAPSTSSTARQPGSRPGNSEPPTGMSMPTA